MIDYCHVIVDGLSVKKISQYISDVLQGASDVLNINEKSFDYYDYWYNFQTQYSQNCFEQDINYWIGELKGISLFEEFPVYKNSEESNLPFRLILDDDMSDKVKSICKNNEMTEFIFFLSIYAMFLHAFIAQKDITIGVPFSCKHSIDSDNDFGQYVNTLVFRSSNIDKNQNIAYEKYGLAQEFSFVDLLSAKGDSNLVLVPDFMCKYRNSLDGNYYIFNPIMEEVTCESECSDIAKDADDIVIYISTGSIINNQEFLYKCIEASLLIPNCEVHISAGVNFDEILKKYGDYSQLFVYKFAPQKAILNRAKLFITHGGMNSVCESIYYKTPMVIIPFVNDEYLNAIMVEQNNFGEMLKLNVSEQQLFETISRVICDESIANSISDASELMKSTNALEEVLTYFQSVVQKKTINSNM